MLLLYLYPIARVHNLSATETAVLKIHHDIVSGLDNGKCTVFASLGLSAAVDTVDHSIFIARIQQLYGVDNVCKRLV